MHYICGVRGGNQQSQEIWHLFGKHVWTLKGFCLTHSVYAQRSLRKCTHKEDTTVLEMVIDLHSCCNSHLKGKQVQFPFETASRQHMAANHYESSDLNVVAVLKFHCFVTILLYLSKRSEGEEQGG